MRIRDYRPSDLPYLYDICLRTGDSGKDASALLPDPFIIGQYYAAPYAARDGRCVLILEGERGETGLARPIGYILGTDDTASYNAWLAAEWLPGCAALYGSGPEGPAAATAGGSGPGGGQGPAAAGAPGAGGSGRGEGGQAGQAGTPAAAPSLYERLAGLFATAPATPAYCGRYPGHIHIDILPEGQGAGWGRRLMDAFSDRLRSLGCPGFHLGVGARNQAGVAFYRRYGMEELEAPAWGFVFGKRL